MMFFYPHYPVKIYRTQVEFYEIKTYINLFIIVISQNNVSKNSASDDLGKIVKKEKKTIYNIY